MRWVPLLFLAACAPKAAPTVVPVATASAAPVEPAPSHNGPCLARTTLDVPEGWVPGGAITITMRGGRPTQLTLVDASGKTLATETPVEEKQIKKQITTLACRADSWLAIPGPPPNKPDGDIGFALYRPGKSDEAADVALLCSIPKEAADPSADESQRAEIAALVYSERLTSVRYRSWFYELDRELGAAQSDTDRITVKQANGEKLAGLLKGKADGCWFVKVLRR